MKADRRQNEAADAWRRGREAVGHGDLTAARFWLDRTTRVAPDDPRPRFELAVVLAALGDAAAVPALEAIATRYDYAEAWLAVVRVHHRNGDYDEAAAVLAAVLQHHEMEPDRKFERLARDIVAKTGHAGWCGMARGQRIFRGDRGADNLLGSPIDLANFGKVEGIIEAVGPGLAGWVVSRTAPHRPPKLEMVDREGTRRIVRPRTRLEPVPQVPFLPRHSFRISKAQLLDLVMPVRIESADGTSLFGSPINPAVIAALAPTVSHPSPHIRPHIRPGRAELCAVMPVFRNHDATVAALESLYDQAEPPARIIVIDDASPEAGLSQFLDREQDAGRVTLIRHRVNRGFPAAANAGIRAAQRTNAACDILLLNADILLPCHASTRLADALYAAQDIASATPLSNEATILSYPLRSGGNPAPDAKAVARLNDLAWRVNKNILVDIPTGIGFGMAMRHDALHEIGLFREDVFAQGYGEENDWCRRAADEGFRNVAVPGVYVGHRGGASFGAAGAALCARNLQHLERLHPGYHALIAAHHEDDPLREARFRLDQARFRAGRKRAGAGTGAVVLVSHDHGGGIARIVASRMAALRREGKRPILLQPDFSTPISRETGIGQTRVTDGAAGDYPNLCFALPEAWDDLLALLRDEKVEHVEFHHNLGHDPLIRDLPAGLGVPYEHVIHDYSSFCKRINLIGPQRRYCGEPDVQTCVACVAEAGSELTDPIAPPALVARSAAEFRAARRVTAPSADAAARIRRHFPRLRVAVEPWEDDSQPADLVQPPASGENRVIAVVGGIGPAKGYDILLDCARDAQKRNLGLSFVLIGASENDIDLIEAGVRITGPYQEGEAAGLIRASGAALGFLPSIWPETWCFALGEMWRGGLYTLAFDIGAQAERIRATQRGFVLPLGLPATRINQTLLAWQPDLGDLNNRIR